MADHFLTKTRIDLGRCIDVDGARAVDQYETLFRILSEKAGPDVAKLFAEPLISKGNDQAASTVSWYSDRPGQGTPISKLDASAQVSVKSQLSEGLAAVKHLLDDAEVGGLAAAALYIGGTGDIWSVDGKPVLVNWGLMPEAGSDAASRAAHYTATLGPYLAMESPPPLTEAEQEQQRADKVAAVATATAAATVAAIPAAAAGAPTGAERVAGGQSSTAASGVGSSSDGGPPIANPTPRRRVPLIAWLPMVLLLALFGGVLAWLLTPGNRIFADDGPQPAIADADTLLAAREINRALEQRLAELNVALDGAVCRADGTLLVPDGLTIEGLLPPEFDGGRLQGGEIVEGDKTPVLPPSPERVRIPSGTGQVTDTASLLEHIDARTAMVVAGTETGIAVGTGFFVGPDLLVTNFHVLEGATPENIFVTNKTLGGLKRVEILKQFGPMRDVGADFALLRVDAEAQPFYTIHQSDASIRLQSVIAAGYPGDVLKNDSDFQALKRGDASAVPGLTVTDGTVNAEQALSDTTNTVVHSAPLSTGNSGGPLIDLCGRVVGVNTYVLPGALRNLNFALATQDLLAFLQDTPAQPIVESGSCAPLVARPMPVPASNQ